MLQNLAEVFSECEMFSTKVVAKIKTRILFPATFFQKSCRLWDENNYCIAGQDTDDTIIRRMRSACWLTTAAHTRTHTHSEYIILLPFHGNNGYANAPHYYVTCTRWFKYDRDKVCLVYTQIVPVIFEPPCTLFALCLACHYLYFTVVHLWVQQVSQLIEQHHGQDSNSGNHHVTGTSGQQPDRSVKNRFMSC